MPKKTTGIIIESSNDYVIGVKMNQPSLFKQVEATMADKNKRSSWYSETEINRGRTELRTVTVSNNLEGIGKEWIGIKQLISIERIVDRQGKKSKEMAYFISSKNTNAFKYKEGIRLHWEIENSLHYVKDVNLKRRRIKNSNRKCTAKLINHQKYLDKHYEKKSIQKYGTGNAFGS